MTERERNPRAIEETMNKGEDRECSIDSAEPRGDLQAVAVALRESVTALRKH
jgi:hypothetical protein